MIQGASSKASYPATVAAGLVSAFLEFAAAHGAERAALAEAAGLDPSLLNDHDARVPFDVYLRLVRAAAEQCNDPAIHVHFAASIDMSAFSVVGLLANASQTMMEAFAQLNRYGQLVVEVDVSEGGRFTIDMRDGQFWMVDLRKDPNASPELTESTFTRFAAAPARFLPGPHVLEVHFTHPAPAYRVELERIYKCPVRFNMERNAMRMDPAMLQQRVGLQPRYVFGALSKHADGLMQSLAQSKTVRGRVEAALMPVLHTGDIGMDAVGEKLGLTRSALYHALKTEDVTFETILDALRQRLALDYLGAGKASVNEVAYLTGFSDPAAFSRAFKRWTGLSPRAYRDTP